jgi:hypothetical protein
MLTPTMQQMVSDASLLSTVLRDAPATTALVSAALSDIRQCVRSYEYPSCCSRAQYKLFVSIKVTKGYLVGVSNKQGSTFRRMIRLFSVVRRNGFIDCQHPPHFDIGVSSGLA